MVWTLHWKTSRNPKSYMDVVNTKEDALRAAKIKQSEPDVILTKIIGTNGEVLTAEKIFQLIKDP